jgi:hypothetical protein
MASLPLAYARPSTSFLRDAAKNVDARQRGQVRRVRNAAGMTSLVAFYAD